ncbi:reticulophagy, partial [Homalodisca vitripennis]
MEAVTEEDQVDVLNHFLNLNTKDQQDLFLQSLIDVNDIKHRRPRTEDARTNCAAFTYHVMVGTDRVQFTEETVSNIQTPLTKLMVSFGDKNMRTIQGLPERFSGLDKLLNKLSCLVKEQGDLAEAMDMNSRKANMLGDTSILPDLCMSHRRQLIIMQRNHGKIMEINWRVDHAKREMIKILNGRLKWTYSVQCQMAALLEHTHMSSSGLATLKEKLNLVQQIHTVPRLYFTAVEEVVRRRKFSCTFLKWANGISSQLSSIHAAEVDKRELFQALFKDHILSSLFPGLQDFPPPFATQAPEPFDTKLPKLELDNVKMLNEDMIPDFSTPVSLPDFKALSQFFQSNCIISPKKPKEEECLLEEERAIEQPLESQPSGPELELINSLEYTENRVDCKEDQEVSQLHQTKEQVQKFIATVRNDLGSLKECLHSEHNHVHSLLQQLTSAYRSEADIKDQHIYELRQEVACQEAEIEDLRKQLARSLEAEKREREERQQEEAARNQAVSEV